VPKRNIPYSSYNSLTLPQENLLRKERMENIEKVSDEKLYRRDDLENPRVAESIVLKYN
jgi:hypothetical protein